MRRVGKIARASRLINGRKQKSISKSIIFVGAFWGRFLDDFWPIFDLKNGANLGPKWERKLMLTWNADFSKIVLSLQRGLDFSDFRGRSWEQKSTKKRAQDGKHLGIYF